MGRPTKENSLNRQDVIKAAIACVEKEGASGLGVNRVAKELGIKPPAIYKHLQGNAELKKAVALAIYQQLFAELKQKMTGITEPRDVLMALGFASRDFARSHPGLFQVMMQFQLQPDDPKSASVIRETQSFLAVILRNQNLDENKSIDIMRMINSAIVGFINLEQSGLLTLPRSTEKSFGVMLEALLMAIEQIKQS